MPSTYTPIATQALESAASSITFNSIPGTYTDLVLVVNAGVTTAGGNALSIQLNGETSSVYSTTRVNGNGSAAGSYRATYFYGFGFSMTNELTSNTIFHINNYANTNVYKTILQRFNNSSSGTSASVTLFPYTAAVTSINLSAEIGATNLLAGSTFTLYGITAA